MKHAILGLAILLLSCNLDVEQVNGFVDNREGACDRFDYEITIITTLGTRKEIGSVSAGMNGIIYATGLSAGTNISITGDCFIGQQSVKLTGSYYNPERYTNWVIRVTNRSSPKLVPPF
jgi:hypothetical protein